MKTSPLISIITPTLNSAETVLSCLKSVAEQDYKNIEHIIIDGNSSDATLDIVKGFSSNHSYIRLISEPDSGIYDAMNKGIFLSKGTWLYFLGSDDIFYCENVLSNIFNNKLIYTQKIIYGNVLINGNAGWAKNGQIYDGKFTLHKLIEKNICHQAIFYKKDVFNKGDSFNSRYTICADWDMNLRMWASFKFYYLEIIIAIFKGGNSSNLIENNYYDIDKWLNIVNSFRFGIASKKFTPYSENFLILSQYFKNGNKYFKSFLLKGIFYLHRIRVHLRIK
jgi:glycosyltransferase involved in cell wall biosynthesis